MLETAAESPPRSVPRQPRSREAAKECRPRRKALVVRSKTGSSEGAKETHPRTTTRRRHEQASEGLQLRASVRIDFAVQANFFKSRRGPFHDFPQRSKCGPCNIRLGYPTQRVKAIRESPCSAWCFKSFLLRQIPKFTGFCTFPELSLGV